MKAWQPDRVLQGNDGWASPYTTQQYRASWPYFHGQISAAELKLMEQYIEAAEVTTAAIFKMMEGICASKPRSK